MQKIETHRLILRNFSEADSQGLLEYLGNPRVSCFLDERTSTLEEAALKVQKRSKDDSYVAVCLKDSDYLIGELFYLKEEPDTYSIGWNFNAQFEGLGYANESVKAFLKYLFMQLGARRLYSYVEDDNYRSQKLCDRLGMRKEGYFIEFISFTKYEDGTPKYENTFQYALLKKEWLKKQSS
ncbi:GNAT family N-acetyltransferase [Paenibacillus eucommiae]|uniref:RimJ/RimL family protein N-acetyltransferase n=1 Tax=Paenibacillus eucommiae TaxID=1355755 RepID=A0ABS4J1J8_9BACL|nr:GNAT family N-acetyltransferase [Paenibacillus eucommiae]MBP1993695.1 RimJ/RimL family protein N-acetyltransferase [Paenibacillus eucommiae]